MTRRSLLTLVLGLAGVALFAWVIRGVGVAELGALLARARAAFLVGLVLEGLRIACEGLGSAALFPARIRRDAGVWRVVGVELRTYAVCQLAPMGRTVAEALKVPLLERHGTVADRIGVAVRSQALGLLSIAVISVPCVIASALEHGGGARGLGGGVPRTTAIAVHGTVVLVSALVLLGTGAHEKMARLVARRWPHVMGAPAAPPRAAPATHEADATTGAPRGARALALATPWFVAARVVQLLQVLVFASALAGTYDLRFALVALGVGYAGAGAGELVPGHMGTSEAAAGIAAAGMGVAPEVLVGIAVLVRGTQIVWSFVSLLVPVTAVAATRLGMGARGIASATDDDTRPRRARA